MNRTRSRQTPHVHAAIGVFQSLLALGAFSGCVQPTIATSETVGEAAAASADCSSAPNDNYPYATARFCTDSSCVDPWNFFQRQCTSFVAFRMNRLGLDFRNGMQGGHFGNANHWDDNAKALGYTVDNTPAPNAIAVWNSGQHGHVAFVRCVTDDGQIVVEEYNRQFNGKYGTRTISASSPDNYIHMQ